MRSARLSRNLTEAAAVGVAGRRPKFASRRKGDTALQPIGVDGFRTATWPPCLFRDGSRPAAAKPAARFGFRNPRPGSGWGGRTACNDLILSRNLILRLNSPGKVVARSNKGLQGGQINTRSYSRRVQERLRVEAALRRRRRRGGGEAEHRRLRRPGRPRCGTRRTSGHDGHHRW